jgi:hypothetical protein
MEPTASRPIRSGARSRSRQFILFSLGVIELFAVNKTNDKKKNLMNSTHESSVKEVVLVHGGFVTKKTGS